MLTIIDDGLNIEEKYKKTLKEIEMLKIRLGKFKILCNITVKSISKFFSPLIFNRKYYIGNTIWFIYTEKYLK